MSRVENFEENNQDDSGHKSLPQVHWSAVYLEQLRVATVYYVYPFMWVYCMHVDTDMYPTLLYK